jgi:APA family basic amino acid/polyamine antiporter
VKPPALLKAGSPPILHLRLVQEPPRVWAPLDAFLYNLMTTNIAVSFGLPLIAGAAFYFPLRDMTAAILVAGAFCLAEALVYAFLVSSFPKNGGDYVFQRRLLNGPIGAVFAFTGVVVGGALWMAIAGWFAAKIAVGPFLVFLGTGLHSPAISRAGTWVLSTPGLIALGLLATLWSCLINLWGMRVYARIQRVLLLVGFVALCVLVTYFALTKLSINQSAYRGIIYKAVEQGFTRQGRSDGLDAMLALLPIVAFGLIYPGWIVFQAAEVKRVGELRVQLTTIVGAKAVSIVFALVVLPLPIRHIGEELFGASIYLALHDPTSFWVLAPRLLSITSAPWLGPIILFSLAVAVNTWFWIWVPNHTLAASRVLLAMSWDRLLPRWFSDLQPNGVPGKAIVAFSLACSVLVLLYSSLGVWRLALHATLVNLLAFAVTCVAAALFPYVRRELYRDSTAAPFEVIGVPVITLAATCFVAFAGLLAWLYVTTDVLALGTSPGETLLSLAALYGASTVLYVAFRFHRRRSGEADVELYYREVAAPRG